MCAARSGAPTQSVLQGIDVPAGCYYERFAGWSYYGGQLLGQNPMNGCLYVYTWKSRKEGSDGIFDLHVFCSHPVTRRWSEVLKTTGIEGHMDLNDEFHAAFMLMPDIEPSEWAVRSGKSAVFDFDGKQAGFWLLPYANTRGGIFVLWDVTEDQSKIYRVKAIDRRVQIHSLGYSSHHGSFIALTEDEDRPTGRLNRILFLEDGTLEFQSFLTFCFGQNPGFRRICFCPGSFAMLLGRQLNVYDYKDNSCESFKVIGWNYDSLPNREEATRLTEDAEMQVLGKSNFVFPYEWVVGGDIHPDRLVKISRLGGHYEATTIPIPWLPLRRFRQPKTRTVVPIYKQQIENHWMTVSFVVESVHLAGQSLHIVVSRIDFRAGRNQKAKPVRESWIVEVPILEQVSFLQLLGILAAKQVLKNSSEELWEGAELKTDKIAEKLGVPEKLVTKYFVG